ncbi:MAG: FG-GAP-like repeat-containing protein [Pyrinomonadaceae bacterium]
MNSFSLSGRFLIFVSICVFSLIITCSIFISSKTEAADNPNASPKTVFSNSSPITINTVATPTPTPLLIPAATYPSTINVSGLTGTTAKVTVSLRGFTHKRTNTLDFLLVSPTGQKFIILSDIGSFNYPVNDVDITFDDDAPTLYPSDGVIYSGTYRPRNSGSSDVFPDPAPPGPYDSSLNSTLDGTFGGADPNGDWSLYIVSQGNFSDVGGLNLGWSLNVTTSGSAATTFVNSNYLEISSLRAKANPYGSVISVSGLSGVVSELKVSLSGITHGRAQDIDVLLVSPNGTAMILMGDTGNGPASNIDLTFDDAAAQPVPSGTLTTGTFRPANYNSSNPVPDSDTFLPPAPLEPYFTSGQLAQFNDINPNGDWVLYVSDDAPGESGEIAGGWSLDITTAPFVPVQIGCIVPTLSLSNNFGVGTGPTHLATGDFDNMSGPDLVVTNQISNDVSVLLNDGNGDFTNQTLITAGSSPYAVAVGHFNSDPNQDLAVINSASNNVSIFLGNGNGTFSTATNFPVGVMPISVAVADFNDDMNEDLVVANFGGFFSGTASVLFGDGNGGFSSPTVLRTRTQPSYAAVGNFNGDNLPDVAVATFGSDSVAVFINNGNGGFFLSSNVPVGSGPVFIEVVDLNNDGKDDLQVANFNADSISQRFGTGNGTFTGTGNAPIGLNPTAVVSGDFTQNDTGIQNAVTLSGSNSVKFLQGGQVGAGTFPYSLVKGDFNGDGKLDLATANSDSNNVSVLLNSCQLARGNLFDFNADRLTDYAVFRPPQTSWYSATVPQPPKNFGKPTDTLVPADYDGDGDTDYAIFRPESGLWYGVDLGNNPLFYLQFGLTDDVPVPADFDGDTKADIAVWRPGNGTWYVRRSSDNSLQIYQFGMMEDRPAPADYDGDGKADFAVFRPSTGVWYIQRSGDGGFTILQFGVDTDRILPADYDGDGKADVAVWRPSTGVWYVLRSTDGGFTIIQYGMDSDVPVPGDYDGDGRFDLAVYRPGEGNWYVFRSSDNVSQVFTYGVSTDYPIPNSFVR